MRLTACWPAAGDAVAVTQVSGAADAAKAERAAQLRFEGRSLAAALEAVERELA